MNQFVLSSQDDCILTLTLNRPEVLNAFNLGLIKELIEKLKQGDADPAVKVIIITGAGKAFSAGGDIKAMVEKNDMFAGDEAELEKIYKEGIQQIPLTLEGINTPTIAMVNGAAVGAGCDLACMCDMRVVSDKAFFKESFVNLSLVSGDGGSFFLHRLIGYGRTMEMMLTGRKVNASEAVKIGLANLQTSPESLEKETKSFAQLMSRPSLNSLKLNKKVVKDAFIHGLPEHLDFVANVQAKTQRSEEHQNLVKQFFQKS